MNTVAKIEDLLKEMGADGVLLMKGYVQARFDTITKANEVSEKAFNREAEITPCPSGFGFNLVWCK